VEKFRAEMMACYSSNAEAAIVRLSRFLDEVGSSLRRCLVPPRQLLTTGWVAPP
jgi:hypothetical protein